MRKIPYHELLQRVVICRKMDVISQLKFSFLKVTFRKKYLNVSPTPLDGNNKKTFIFGL